MGQGALSKPAVQWWLSLWAWTLAPPGALLIHSRRTPVSSRGALLEKPHPGSPGSPPPPPAGNPPRPGVTPSTLHRAPVGQGPSGPGWLAIALGFWSGRALATGTAWVAGRRGWVCV